MAELLTAWTLTVWIGAATLTCSAQVIGDVYQNACEDAGGHYYRDGERWACRAEPPAIWEGADAEAAVAGDEVSECVEAIIGGPA